MGTPDFAVPSLKLLAAQYNILAVYSQPPRPNVRGMKTIESPIQSTAKKLNLKTMTPHTLKSDDVFDEYKKLKPDVVVVVAYGLILPEKYLKIPKFGCVNGHASNLPRWRGAAPIQRAIEAGDTTSGSCIMIMEKGMDTGPILLSKKINIENNDTSKSLHDKLSDLTAQILEEALYKYTKGILLPQKQEIEGIKYAHKIKKIESENSMEVISVLNHTDAPVPFKVHQKMPYKNFNAEDFKPDFDKKYVVICKKGITSYDVTLKLKEKFPTLTIFSLVNGIDNY